MTDANPIDPAALETMLEMFGGDTSFLAEMIDTYLEDSPQLLASLEQAIQAGDAGLVQRAAHSLKSNSESFGAMGLVTIARSLEHLGKQADLVGADALLSSAVALYAEVRTALLAARPDE